MASVACVAVVLASAAAFLLQRGIKTLALRVERQSTNALALAAALETHPLVSTVASMYCSTPRQGAAGGAAAVRPVLGCGSAHAGAVLCWRAGSCRMQGSCIPSQAPHHLIAEVVVLASACAGED